MLINDTELLDEFVDFMLTSEDTYVCNEMADYFSLLNGSQPSFTEWLGRIVDVALHQDRFQSELPGWQDIDLTEAGYDSILFRSLLNNPSFKDKLMEEFEYLIDTLDWQ